MDKEIISLAFRTRIGMLIIGKLLDSGKINIPVHLAFGHELIAARLVLGSSTGAEFFLPHRNAHYNIIMELMESAIPEKYILELLGSKVSKYKGRLGSMNYTDPGMGGYTSSILANHLGPAVGAAMYFKFNKINKRAVAVIGDGAAEEGRFWESLQFAYGKKLPLDIIIEDNDWSMQSQTWQRRSNIAFDQIPAIMTQGTDLNSPHAGTGTLDGPRIIHERCNTLGGLYLKEDVNERFINYHCGKVFTALPMSERHWCFSESDPLAATQIGQGMLEDLCTYEKNVNSFIESI
jgi:hypothetical protein